MRLSRFVIVLLVACGLVVHASAQTLAFPGADGYGRYAAGGRGGKVIEVTNLNDSGPGSLRAAIQENGARTVVFRVSGTIALKSELLIQNGDLTIAGQTAPGDGICIKNYMTSVAANNVIIRFLRFRLGDETRQIADALGAMGCKNVIIDHCSMSWGIDEVGSFYDNEDFTLQWCIISESLYNSCHHKGPHGFGGIWGGARASFHHNLFAHNSSRNPRFQGGRTLGKVETELVDFRNNVVFNWGFACGYGGEAGRQNVAANYFKAGPATLRKDRFLEPSDTLGRWFVSGNHVVGFPAVSADNWKDGVKGPYLERVRVTKPFAFVAAVTQSPEQAYNDVLSSAGAIFPKRDVVDQRIIQDVRNGTATYGDQSYAKDHRLKRANTPRGIIDTQRSVGGWPELKSDNPLTDSDHDGIPDAWELAHGLDPQRAEDGGALTGSGYSNLEIYLNELVSAVELSGSSQK